MMIKKPQPHILDTHSSSLSGLVTFLGKVNGVQSEAGKFSH